MAQQRGALAKTHDGLSLLEKSPQIYGDAFRQFRVCHDLCVYTNNKLLDAKMRDKIDQCAVDFRHISLQSTTLSEQVSSVWCRTCILFFDNLSKIRGDPSKILKKISAQAKDLSGGFSGIAGWCRDLAGKFDDAQTLAKKKSQEYTKSMEKAKEEAEKAMKALRTELKEAAAEAEKKRRRADRWLIAAVIPVVNLVAGVGALITATSASNAEKLRRETDTLCDVARTKLEKATSNSERAKVQCMHVHDKNISAIINQSLHTGNGRKLWHSCDAASPNRGYVRSYGSLLANGVR